MGGALWRAEVVPAIQPVPGRSDSGAAVVADRVCRVFGRRVAVRDLSFEVRRGEIVGLVGPNGAGKTTTIRMMLGLLAPSSGEMRVLGCRSDRLGPRQKRRLAAVLENRGLYEDLTARENLAFYARIYRLPDAADAIERLLRLVGLGPRSKEKARHLSQGMKQKLAIARSLLWNAELLILDEPTAGLDPLFQRDILGLIRQLREGGRTVLLSSHNLQEVADVCTSVAILDEGRLLAFDDVARLTARASLADVFHTLVASGRSGA